MVIGLRYGRITARDKVAEEKTYVAVGEFLMQFKQRNGSVDCTGLLQYNLSDPQQVAEVKKNKVIMTRCPASVQNALQFVETLI